MKTHIGALRPGNYSILIAKCTSPDRSSSQERVIKKLYPEWIKEKSVAKFAVLLSTKKNRGFGFLLDNMIWSWKGHVINTVLHYLNKKENNDLKTFMELTKIEKICYLRYFLQTEGALILKFAERYSKTGKLSYSYLKNNVQEIFKEIIEEYLDIAPNFRVRNKIKDMQMQMKLQMKKNRYNENTLAHKIKPHIQALENLGILTIERQNNEELYHPLTFDNTSTFTIIWNTLKSIQNLENLFMNNDYFSLIAKIYHLSSTFYSYDVHKNLLKDTILYGYHIMNDKITGMADINALIDWCRIKMLSENNVLVSREDIEDFLNKVRKEQPSRIRYHVDGKGRISYLIFSEPL
jgi:hypothetical protein